MAGRFAGTGSKASSVSPRAPISATRSCRNGQIASQQEVIAAMNTSDAPPMLGRFLALAAAEAAGDKRAAGDGEADRHRNGEEQQRRGKADRRRQFLDPEQGDVKEVERVDDEDRRSSPIDPVAVMTMTWRIVEPVVNFAAWALLGDRVILDCFAVGKQVLGLTPSVREYLLERAEALEFEALPDGSRMNSVACSPGSPLKRIIGRSIQSISVGPPAAGELAQSSISSTTPKCGIGTSLPSTLPSAVRCARPAAHAPTSGGRTGRNRPRFRMSGRSCSRGRSRRNRASSSRSRTGKARWKGVMTLFPIRPDCPAFYPEGAHSAVSHCTSRERNNRWCSGKQRNVGPSGWTTPLECCKPDRPRFGAGGCRQGGRRGCRRRGGGARALDRRLGAARQGRNRRKPPESDDVSLRVFVGQRVASVSATAASDPKALAERAVAMAQVSPEDPYPGPRRRGTAGEVRFAISTSSIRPKFPPNRLREDALAAEEAALAVPGVTNSSGSGASAGLGGLVLATSHGFLGQYVGSRFSRSASVIAGEGTGMERDYDYSSRLHFADLDCGGSRSAAAPASAPCAASIRARPRPARSR